LRRWIDRNRARRGRKRVRIGRERTRFGMARARVTLGWPRWRKKPLNRVARLRTRWLSRGRAAHRRLKRRLNPLARLRTRWLSRGRAAQRRLRRQSKRARRAVIARWRSGRAALGAMRRRMKAALPVDSGTAATDLTSTARAEQPRHPEPAGEAPGVIAIWLRRPPPRSDRRAHSEGTVRRGVRWPRDRARSSGAAGRARWIVSTSG
jgi:hypothetical protein